MLNLLWSKAISHNSHDIDMFIDDYTIHETAVFLTPARVRNSTSGTIFVGLSMMQKASNSIERVENENGLNLNENGILEHKDMNIRSKLEHFNVFALDSKSGHVLWRHDGIQRNGIEQYTKSLPQLLNRFELQDLMMKSHQDSIVNDWTNFRHALIRELPHKWSDIDDTYFHISNFMRSHIGFSMPTDYNSIQDIHNKKSRINSNTNRMTNSNSYSTINFKNASSSFNSNSYSKTTTTSQSYSNSKNKFSNNKISRFTGLEMPPLSKSAILPHDASEHIDHPNVIVVHNSNGMEVISISTGISITSLALTSKKTYADLNGDGVIDTLIVLENFNDISQHTTVYADSGSEFKACSIIAVSGLPTRSQLFNGTICANRNSLQNPLSVRSDYLGTGSNFLSSFNERFLFPRW